MSCGLKIPIIFQKAENMFDVSNEDTRFMGVKIWLCHTGKNKNGSFFSKEVIEKAIPTLKNTPILAYIEDNSDGEKDFSDHRVILKKEDGKYSYKYIGMAIGVIPESNEAHFEKRMCDDGVEREFLVTNGIVWQNKWSDAPDIFNRDIVKSQSMEIYDEYSGFYRGDGYYEFTEFSFYGSCALGIDYKPAMINSTIELNYSVDDIAEQITKKLKEFDTCFCCLSKYNKTQEGGKSGLTDELKNKILLDFSVKESDLTFKITDDMTEEDLKAALEKFTSNRTLFSATFHEKRDMLDSAVRKLDRVDRNDDGDIIKETKNYLMDFDDEWVYVERNTWETDSFKKDFFKSKYTETNGEYSISGDEEKIVEKWITVAELDSLESAKANAESRAESAEGELQTYKEAHKYSNEEVEDLINFKDNRIKEDKDNAVNALFESFSDLSENEEFIKLKENAANYSIEELEKECFAIRGKTVQVNFSYKPERKSNRVPLNCYKKEEKPYNGIFEKYGIDK